MARWMRFEDLKPVALAALLAGGCDVGDPEETAVAADQVDAADPSVDAMERVRALPLHFEKNVGQADAAARYISRAPGYNLFLTDTGAVMTVLGPRPRFESRLRPEQAERGREYPRRATAAVVTMTLLGADAKAPFRAERPLEGETSYVKGTATAAWQPGVDDVGAVRRTGIYAGVDVVYYGNGRELEYDFVVAPGADPRQIRLQLGGADRLSLAANGDLHLHIGDRSVVTRAPVVYQEDGGRRTAIDARYRIEGDVVTFELGAYDAGRTLVIDPVLAYSTYLGGSLEDFATSSAVDAAGNLYVSGATTSADFPTPPNALQPDLAGGDWDAFVVKLSPNGRSLIYSTYLGGTGDDFAWAISVDSAGRAYVSGETSSLDFPVVRANQPTHGGGYTDAFVAILEPNGRTLARSTYLGGGDDEAAFAGQFDQAGSFYLVGNTWSTDFPVTAGALQTTNGGALDAFVTKFDAGLRQVRYSTYFGGVGDDYTSDVDVHLGDAFFSGLTTSPDLPVTAEACKRQLSGPADAYVVRLDARGRALEYMTYYGGSVGENAWHIRVPNGVAYIGGNTSSPDLPTRSSSFQPAYGGGPYDGFLATLGPRGACLTSTYFGGSDYDRVGGLAVDRNVVYFTGRTQSTNLPVTPGALQSTAQGDADVFVASLRMIDQKLLYSTYLGGSGFDQSYSQRLTLDANGGVYVVGETTSTDFPVTPGVVQPASAGDLEAFITKFKF